MVVQLWSYGCTTIRVFVVQLQNSDFLTESTNLDNILSYWQLHIFFTFSIFLPKYFRIRNTGILKRFHQEFVRNNPFEFQNLSSGNGNSIRSRGIIFYIRFINQAMTWFALYTTTHYETQSILWQITWLANRFPVDAPSLEEPFWRVLVAVGMQLSLHWPKPDSAIWALDLHLRSY